MPQPANRASGAQVAPSARCHGRLGTIIDSERRALRPIGSSAQEVAERTGDLLRDLFELPTVHIFQGVRPTAADAPRIAHVIIAGRQVVLVESVAWPPGRYAATASGRIYCDGTYTGQSVRPLMDAVRHWRGILPSGHRVGALVVVHPTTAGDLALPASSTRTLAWAHADDAVHDIRSRLSSVRQAISMKAVAALIAATAEDER
ncbi:MAG: hypothetical protein ACRDPY_02065 [Streptosporangiaceae bacterium]